MCAVNLAQGSWFVCVKGLYMSCSQSFHVVNLRVYVTCNVPQMRISPQCSPMLPNRRQYQRHPLIFRLYILSFSKAVTKCTVILNYALWEIWKFQWGFTCGMNGFFFFWIVNFLLLESYFGMLSGHKLEDLTGRKAEWNQLAIFFVQLLWLPLCTLWTEETLWKKKVYVTVLKD